MGPACGIRWAASGGRGSLPSIIVGGGISSPPAIIPGPSRSSLTSLALNILVSTIPDPSASSMPTVSAFANASFAFSNSDFGLEAPSAVRTRSVETELGLTQVSSVDVG